MARTISRFASVRGDFRYQAAALVTKRATGIDWLEEEVTTELDALLGKLMIPHIDDVAEGMVESTLQCTEMLNILFKTAVVGSQWQLRRPVLAGGAKGSPIEAYNKQAEAVGWTEGVEQPALSYSSLLASTEMMRAVTQQAIAHARAGGDWFFELKPLCLAANGTLLFDQMVQEV